MNDVLLDERFHQGAATMRSLAATAVLNLLLEAEDTTARRVLMEAITAIEAIVE